MKEVTYGNRIPSIKNGTLAVDIGGTNTNFGIFHKKKLLLSLHFKSSEITNFNHIVKRVLKHIKEKYSITCIKAGVAAAGRLHKNNIELTNQKWNVKKKDLPFTKVRLMNDFQAMAYGIDVLSKNKILLVKPGTADKGPRVILGAGTGLGKSILLHNGKGYEPLPSEGGHGNFAPTPNKSNKLPNPPVSPPDVISRNLPDNCVKINEIIEVIPITIPAIAGVRNLTCAFIDEITSLIKSFNRASTRCISLIYLDILRSA